MCKYKNCICITGACEGSRIASILKNQVLVFNHTPLEAGACFINRVCFYKGPPKRSSCRDSNE